jgi:hypothetical protein
LNLIVGAKMTEESQAMVIEASDSSTLISGDGKPLSKSQLKKLAKGKVVSESSQRMSKHICTY